MVKSQEKNKAKESKVKKIMSSFWFWFIITIVSYGLFLAMPVKWDETGYGWNHLEGINIFKTFFGYFYAIALFIAIIILIFNIIKSIQKSSIHDYWKISFTILGILLIIVFAFFYIKSYIPEKFDKEAWIKENLQEKGYEVTSVGYMPINKSFAFVTMKSLGDRNDQVWNALISLGVIYENASRYSISILTLTDECSYSIDGNLYRSYRKSTEGQKVYSTTGAELNSTYLYSYLNNEIDLATEKCT